MSRRPATPPSHHRDAEVNPARAAAWRGGLGLGSAWGAVTAEFAVALPAVLLLLALLLAGAAGGVTQLRLEEAARAGARALARGEDPAAIAAIVRKLAGASATASVAADGEWLSVTVADRVGGPLGATVPWTLTARATTLSERPAAQGIPQPMAGRPGAGVVAPWVPPRPLASREAPSQPLASLEVQSHLLAGLPTRSLQREQET